MIRRALKNRWPIPDAARRKIIKELLGVLDAKSMRAKIAAARTLLMADRLNLEQQRLDAASDTPPPPPPTPRGSGLDLSKLTDDELAALDALVSLAEPDSDEPAPDKTADAQ